MRFTFKPVSVSTWPEIIEFILIFLSANSKAKDLVTEFKAALADPYIDSKTFPDSDATDDKKTILPGFEQFSEKE